MKTGLIITSGISLVLLIVLIVVSKKTKRCKQDFAALAAQYNGYTGTGNEPTSEPKFNTPGYAWSSTNLVTIDGKVI